MREYSYIKRSLLRELSNDSRSTVTLLAKKLRCSRNTVVSNIKALEKEFGLKYTVQLNKEAVGLIQNRMFVIRFGQKPKMDDLKELVDDPFIQFAAYTEGDFDMIVVRKVPANMVYSSGEKYVHWGITIGVKLSKYEPHVEFVTPILTHVGFTPILNETINSLDLSTYGMDKTDKDIIMLLNENSRISYKQISRKLKMSVETVRYRFRALEKMKVIKSFTVLLTKPPTQYNMAFFVNYNVTSGILERFRKTRDYYMEAEGKLPLINTLQYLALTSGSNLFYGIACFEDEETAVNTIKEAHLDPEGKKDQTMIHAKIVNILKGYLPIRNVDLSKEFADIDWKTYHV